ncbi:MAG: hypothetical protein D3924_02985 [Candidatus Electrothrix sp. AR4]|nr:hypothetical protein [Candidatus Electrothrix sp. AR4]
MSYIVYKIPVKKEFSFNKTQYIKGQLLKGTFEKIGNVFYFKSNTVFFNLAYLDTQNTQVISIETKKTSPLIYPLFPFFLLLYLVRSVEKSFSHLIKFASSTTERPSLQGVNRGGVTAGVEG